MDTLRPKTIFDSSVFPAEYYRIPSMVVTGNGTVVACCDARFKSPADNPNRIDKVIRRSTDSGEHWGPVITAVKEHGSTRKDGSAALDPALLYDGETGRIFLLYCHTPAGIGINNCKSMVGEEPDGSLCLVKGLRRYLLKNGKVVTQKGGATPFEVNENGDISRRGRPCGNIYSGGAIREAPTSYLMLCESDDDGKTWSRPVSLNRQVKTAGMGFIGPGPGVGIVIKNGPHKGRLVFPVYYSTRKTPPRLSCAVIYSDDKGITWHIGKSPNNTRKIRGTTASDRTIKKSEQLTESQIIELPDGRLKLFMRNHDPRQRVAVAYSEDGGESFGAFQWDDSLPHPLCQMSVVSVPGREPPTAVFVNPNSDILWKRVNGTVRLSEDGGETFPYARQIKDGDFIYSCCAPLPDGTIGVLYEGEAACTKMEFVKITIDWIKNKE